jgi:hypothetical protein
VIVASRAPVKCKRLVNTRWQASGLPAIVRSNCGADVNGKREPSGAKRMSCAGVLAAGQLAASAGSFQTTPKVPQTNALWGYAAEAAKAAVGHLIQSEPPHHHSSSGYGCGWR